LLRWAGHQQVLRRVGARFPGWVDSSAAISLSWEDYQKQYFIGHYNPRGNHFFAYAIKDKVVEWLNPKPITYTNPDAATLDFNVYSEGYE
jgi:hypothetical protein